MWRCGGVRSPRREEKYWNLYKVLKHAHLGVREGHACLREGVWGWVSPTRMSIHIQNDHRASEDRKYSCLHGSRVSLMGGSYIWYEWGTEVSRELARHFWALHSALRSQPTFRRSLAIYRLWWWVIFGQRVSSFHRNSHCRREKSRKPESETAAIGSSSAPAVMASLTKWVLPWWYRTAPGHVYNVILSFSVFVLLYIVCSHLKFPNHQSASLSFMKRWEFTVSFLKIFLI